MSKAGAVALLRVPGQAASETACRSEARDPRAGTRRKRQPGGAERAGPWRAASRRVAPRSFRPELTRGKGKERREGLGARGCGKVRARRCGSSDPPRSAPAEQGAGGRRMGRAGAHGCAWRGRRGWAGRQGGRSSEPVSFVKVTACCGPCVQPAANAAWRSVALRGGAKARQVCAAPSLCGFSEDSSSSHSTSAVSSASPSGLVQCRSLVSRVISALSEQVSAGRGG